MSFGVITCFLDQPQVDEDNFLTPVETNYNFLPNPDNPRRVTFRGLSNLVDLPTHQWLAEHLPLPPALSTLHV